MARVRQKKQSSSPEPPLKDRCTGHCCRCLPIPYSPEELWQAYRNWRAGSNAIRMGGIQTDRIPIPTDIDLIAPMLVYLGEFDKPPSRKVKLTDAQLLGKRTTAHYYRCKHLDEKTGDCTIYPFRPKMCRDYPYEGSCNYAACTWEARKEKPETRSERAKRLRGLKEQVNLKEGK